MDLTALFDIINSPWAFLLSLFFMGIGYICWRVPYEYNTFADCVASIGGNAATIMIPNEQIIDANLTIPANITLEFIHGGFLNIAAGKTVMINGTVRAGFYQIFDGDGTVILNLVRDIYSQWWGAAVGESNQQVPINAAIAAASAAEIAKVYIPDGILSCAGDVDLIFPRIELIGQGKYSTLNFTAGGVNITSVYNKLEKFLIEGTSTDNAILLNAAHQWGIKDVTVENFSGRPLYLQSAYSGEIQYLICAATGVAAQISGGANNHIKILHSSFNTSASAGLIISGQCAVIDLDDVQFEGNQLQGLLARDGVSVLNVLGCYFENNNVSGGGPGDLQLNSAGLNPNRVVNIKHSYFNGRDGNATCVELQHDNYNVHIRNNYFYTAGAVGLAVRYTNVGTYADIRAGQNFIAPGFANNYDTEIIEEDILQSGLPVPLTIAGGIITRTCSYHILSPQGGAVDDLNTINGGKDGEKLILKGDGTFQIDVKHNVGNILLTGGVDYLLPTTTERIELQYDAALAKWIQLSAH